MAIVIRASNASPTISAITSRIRIARLTNFALPEVHRPRRQTVRQTFSRPAGLFPPCVAIAAERLANGDSAEICQSPDTIRGVNSHITTPCAQALRAIAIQFARQARQGMAEAIHGESFWQSLSVDSVDSS